MNIKLGNTLEFIYKNCSVRIAKNIKDSRLSLASIYSKDPKQLSWIANNKRTKNNRYLVCDAVFDTSVLYYNEQGKAVSKMYGLLPKLLLKAGKKFYGVPQMR